MKTNNTEGLTMFEINVLVQQGGRFVVFPNTISKLLKNLNVLIFILFVPKKIRLNMP